MKGCALQSMSTELCRHIYLCRYFLMHIIKKSDTESTDQETYVQESYQQRCLDFFLIGNCFRKQYVEKFQVK
ncbi:Ryanodine receptor [Taenia solium]|eukprot:TsM_000144600 transcript=TsM_000144600 gene=TsM_000144600